MLGLQVQHCVVGQGVLVTGYRFRAVDPYTPPQLDHSNTTAKLRRVMVMLGLELYSRAGQGQGGWVGGCTNTSAPLSTSIRLRCGTPFAHHACATACMHKIATTVRHVPLLTLRLWE